jgi:N-acyl-D-amino-acid deacylase
MSTSPSLHAPFDLLITGGTVIDGSKAPRFDADVGIRDGRIAAIGALAGQAATRTLDARGRIVAPGFIDSHTHDDQALLTQPDMAFKVSQGVTTVVTGNCGISLAPLRAGGPLPAPLNLLDLGARAPFDTFAGFLQALREQPAAVNVVPLVGHTSLRVTAMADLQRSATDAEIGTMQALLQEALDAGAVGLSTGTFYPPAAAASTEEIIGLGRPLTGSGALYATHLRDEADQVMEAMDEAFRIGRELDVPVVLSHHKVQHARNFGNTAHTLGHIRRTMQCQCVHVDCYPYTAGSTMIRTDAGLLDGRVLIASSVPHPECAGRDLADIAAEWGTTRDDAARRLQPGSAIYFMMDEGDVQRTLAFDDTMIGSDGIPLGDTPHPRLWGTFPRVLGHYCRELGLFPLETAVWKMTGLTARNFGLHDRGLLAVGRPADVVVFDAEAIIDRASYAQPRQAAAGIDAVLVNGVLTWQQGAHCGARAGQVITRCGAGAGSAVPANH